MPPSVRVQGETGRKTEDLLSVVTEWQNGLRFHDSVGRRITFVERRLVCLELRMFPKDRNYR
jgi:hypothetical protein